MLVPWLVGLLAFNDRTAAHDVDDPDDGHLLAHRIALAGRLVGCLDGRHRTSEELALLDSVLLALGLEALRHGACEPAGFDLFFGAHDGFLGFRCLVGDVPALAGDDVASVHSEAHFVSLMSYGKGKPSIAARSASASLTGWRQPKQKRPVWL